MYCRTSESRNLMARNYKNFYWLICLALLLMFHAYNGLNSDEGVILNGAWNLINGRVLYTDFFEHIAPGSFYVVYAAWSIFGVHFWIAKLLGVSAIFFAGVGIYYTSKLLVSQDRLNSYGSVLLVGPLIYFLISGFWPAINHNVMNIPLVIWSVYFVIKEINLRSYLNACSAGALSGFAVLFLQHRGLVVIVTVLLFYGAMFLRERDGYWLKVSAAFIGSALIPVMALFLFWPPSILLEYLILFPTFHYINVNWVNPAGFLITASFIVLITYLLRFKATFAVCFIMLLQTVLLLSCLLRADYFHITLILFPLLMVAPLIQGVPLTRNSYSYSWFIRVGVFFVLAAPVILPIQFLSARPLFMDRSSDSLALSYIEKHCSNSPYIYAGPFMPGIYFETRKLNPSRYGLLLTGLNTDAQLLEAAKDIEVHKPACAILNYQIVKKFHYNKVNPVDLYITEHYEPVYQEGDTYVYMLQK